MNFQGKMRPQFGKNSLTTKNTRRPPFSVVIETILKPIVDRALLLMQRKADRADSKENTIYSKEH